MTLKLSALFVFALLFFAWTHVTDARKKISYAPNDLSKVYAVWYCGDDQCTWASQPNLSNMDWILNRGDGKPTANLVIFSFVNPMSLLQPNGIPAGFTQDAVNFFTSQGIGVLFSIGGASYTPLWDQALAQNPTALAQNAAAISKQYGVGFEIDYENENSVSIAALDVFVKTYRQEIPFGWNAENLLNVDVGAGTGYLTSVSKAAGSWISQGLVNWENAMVTGSPYTNLSDATQYWEQHLNGANWANISALPGNELVVSLYSSDGSNNCNSYSGTVLEGTVGWVNQNSVRGISFWAVGCPGPNDCVTVCPGIQQGSEQFLN